MLFSLSLIGAMLYFDFSLTVLALLPVPVAMLLAKATGRWVASRTTTSRQASASLTTPLQEQLAGVRVLRLFGRTGAAVERIDTLSGEQADANLTLVRLRSGLRPDYATLMTAGILLGGVAGGRAGHWRRDHGGDLHSLPGALSPFCQPGLSGPPDDQLDPGGSRGLRPASSASGSPAAPLRRADPGLLPCRPHRWNQ